MGIRSRARRLLGLPSRAPDRIRRDVDDEIAFHLEQRADELMRQGMEPDDALSRAAREFGDIDGARHALAMDDMRLARRAERRAWLDALRQDVRVGARALRRRPGFTAAAVLTLALGIGANTAVYGVVRAVLLRPLPYAEPDRLVALWERHDERGVEKNVVSSGNYMDWRERNRSFSDMGVYSGPFGLALTGGDRPEHVTGRSVSPSLFAVLGVPAALGRVFDGSRSDDVLISHGLWQRRFGGERDVVGRTLYINEEPYRIAGVMPGSFRFPTAETDLWLARPFDEDDRQTRDARQWYVVGRLADGATVDGARAEMLGIATTIASEHPRFMDGWSVTVLPYRHGLVGEARPALLALLGAAGLLLVVACANVGNLLLARGLARRTETAVRAALGAGRGRLIRQFLVECGLLALLGGAAGVLAAVVLTRVLVALGPADLPLLDQTRVDGEVIGFAAGAMLLCTLLAGLLPALRLSGDGLRGAIASAAAHGGDSADRRTRGALMIGAVAVSVVLLVGAGLLMRSFVALNRVDYGFDAERLAAAQLDLGSSRYATDESQIAFVDGLRDRISALPGVESVAGTSDPPVVGYQFQFSFAVAGRARPGPNPMEEDPAYLQAVTPGFFEDMGIPLLRGRGIVESDSRGAAGVAVISRELERRVFPDGDALGRRISFRGPDEGPWFEIVGVAGDTRHVGLELDPPPTIYIAFAQKPWTWLTNMTLLVRARGEPVDIVPAIRDEVLALDPNLPLQLGVPVRTLYAESIARQRFVLALIGGFAGIALLLGAVGLYGVAAYAVAQRRREIGLRVALGARPSEATGLVLRHGLALALCGVALGIAAALALTRLLGDLLYGVGPRDPWTFGVVALLLTLVAAVACWIPARRAARVDPMVALRAE